MLRKLRSKATADQRKPCIFSLAVFLRPGVVGVQEPSSCNAVWHALSNLESEELGARLWVFVCVWCCVRAVWTDRGLQIRRFKPADSSWIIFSSGGLFWGRWFGFRKFPNGSWG